ncbi:AEC family transporter [Novosphingobium sp. 1949]|uniref:AEC family transporter n=1 Tax=Novosphingobium organovorum TaxID=2930092 RepID=A0ABT0BEH6_9SPHN|nr:AEC family transporter [Novosphingobium organovorum]MCJ2183414.1 AEC family transporter [Novosphingobium organovorum]
MLTPLLTVLPVFALIFAGWLAGRLRALGPQATSELNRFVVWLALPALLFEIVAKAHSSELWRPGFLAVLVLGTMGTFALTIALNRRHGLADATIDGLNAAYANSGYMGFPIMAVVLGAAGRPLTLISVLVTVCVLFATGIVLIEAAGQKAASPGRLVLKVARRVLSNPLVAAPLAASLFPISGLGVPAPLDSFLTMLGGAASPCALVALGLFLAAERSAAPAPRGRISALIALKLIAQPIVTWLLAAKVFALSPVETHAAVILAALPTGTGPFMLAEFYGREAEVTARVVLVSTILSLATITGTLWWAL